jgi:hypothetical protein
MFKDNERNHAEETVKANYHRKLDINFEQCLQNWPFFIFNYFTLFNRK